jgi:carbonic anhydrase/acetyltransferase-like protein (isoleucine patch superfamily)
MTIRRIGPAWIADTARVIGDVEIGLDTSIWYGTVIRGDVAAIRIGAGSNVQDNCVIHCDTDFPNHIGARVSIGHGALVHGVFVDDDALIGMGAKLLAGTRIGKRCLIGAGAVVPPNLVVPDDHVVMGVPGRIVRETTEAEKTYLAFVAPHYQTLARRHCEEPDHPTVRAFGS